MENKKLKIVISDLEDSSYDKPERENSLIPEVKYDKVDESCKNGVKIANTGVILVKEEELSNFLTDPRMIQLIL